MPSANLDENLRGSLYDRTGMNFFVCEIDGEWHGGWFRIDGRRLEVASETQCRSVSVVDPELMTDLLRKVLAEIVHESASPIPTPEPREEQALVSASLRSDTSDLIVGGDSAKEREH